MKELCGYQGATPPIILRTDQSQNKLNSVHYLLPDYENWNKWDDNSNDKKASKIRGMNF